MVYCTKADLVERFGEKELQELTDEATGTVTSDDEVTAACSEASSEIDLYVGRRYPVPLVSPDAVVKKWACALARLALWGERAGVDSTVRTAAEDVLKVLKDIANGIAILPGAASASGAAPVTAAGLTERTQNFPDSLFADNMVTLP